MNTKIKSISIVIVLCALSGAAQAAAAEPQDNLHRGQFDKQDQPALTVAGDPSGGNQVDLEWVQYFPQGLPVVLAVVPASRAQTAAPQDSKLPPTEQEQRIMAIAAGLPVGNDNDPYWNRFMPPNTQIWASIMPTPSTAQANVSWIQYMPTEQEQRIMAIAAGLPVGQENDPYWSGHVSPEQVRVIIPINPSELKAGTWRLAHFEVVDTNGEVLHPLGDDVAGYLLITPEHYAAVTIAQLPMKKEQDGFISYVGMLDYEGDRSIHPIVSLNPAIVGVDQVKQWQLVNGQLTLITPAGGDNVSFGRLVWEFIK